MPPGAVVAQDISVRELRSTLESMRDEPGNCRVRILKCVWLQQPVAALDNQSSVDEVPIASPLDGVAHLFVAERYFADGPRDLETVCRNLWRIFQQPINEGRFSYRVDDEEFQPFGESDLAFVERALAHDDDG